MKLLINILLRGVGVYLAAYFLSGVVIADFVTALIVGVLLALVNTFIKPILVLLTLPINLMTLGLFSLVVNAFLVYLVAYLVAGFRVENFFWAIFFSLALSLINFVLFKIIK